MGKLVYCMFVLVTHFYETFKAVLQNARHNIMNKNTLLQKKYNDII